MSTISAVSFSRLARAAADAPPATPPMITIFMASVLTWLINWPVEGCDPCGRDYSWSVPKFDSAMSAGSVDSVVEILLFCGSTAHAPLSHVLTPNRGRIHICSANQTASIPTTINISFMIRPHTLQDCGLADVESHAVGKPAWRHPLKPPVMFTTS